MENVSDSCLKQAMRLLSKDEYTTQAMDDIITEQCLTGAKLMSAEIIRKGFFLITEGEYGEVLHNELMQIFVDSLFCDVVDKRYTLFDFSDKDIKMNFKKEVYAITDNIEMEHLIYCVGIINMAYALNGSFEFDDIKQHVLAHISRKDMKEVLDEVIHTAKPYAFIARLSLDDFNYTRKMILRSMRFISYHFQKMKEHSTQIDLADV